MWHKPCRTFHPWCPCIKTRCLSVTCDHTFKIDTISPRVSWLAWHTGAYVRVPTDELIGIATVMRARDLFLLHKLFHSLAIKISTLPNYMYVDSNGVSTRAPSGSSNWTIWILDKMVAILQTIFYNSVSCIKIVVFWFKCVGSLFPRLHLTIFQHWFGWWLGADQVTSHYMNQWWFY